MGSVSTFHIEPVVQPAALLVRGFFADNMGRVVPCPFLILDCCFPVLVYRVDASIIH